MISKWQGKLSIYCLKIVKTCLAYPKLCWIAMKLQNDQTKCKHVWGPGFIIIIKYSIHSDNKIKESLLVGEHLKDMSNRGEFL